MMEHSRRFKMIYKVILIALLFAVADSQDQFQNQQHIRTHRVRRGDFYGPNGLGAGGGGGGFGFYGSSFNPVLFQGAAVSGGFANEAYKANEATLAGADGLLSGGSFGVSYYAGAIAQAAATGAAAGTKHKGGSGLTYGRRR